MSCSQKDRFVLQELARQYMEAASLPVQQERRMLWSCLNRGEPQRPMFVIDQVPVHELNDEGELTAFVEDPVFRGIEMALRLQLYQWRHFPADMVLEPFVSVPMAVENSGYGIAVAEQVAVTDPQSSVVSHHYENQIKTEEDLCRIKNMQIRHDTKETVRRLEEAADIFAGIVPVRAAGIQFHLGLWDHISSIMGIETIYMDLMDRPAFIHKIMRRFTDATIAGIEEANRLGVHNDTASTCHCSYLYSDSYPQGNGGGKSQNAWAFGMAQLFSSVSPQTTEEFELPYISELASLFGNLYYGCCERLNDRLEIVGRIPNVRKVSCSPWNDVDRFAQSLPKHLVMSYKPNPAVLGAETFDEQAAREELRRAGSAAQQNGLALEIILKDLSTVQHQPQRLTRWNEIASELFC